MKSLFFPAAFRLSALMALAISSFFSPASHAQLLTPAQQVDSIVAVVEDDAVPVGGVFVRVRRQRPRTSFSASLDGSLKDVDCPAA